MLSSIYLIACIENHIFHFTFRSPISLSISFIIKMSLPIDGYGQGLYNSVSSRWNEYDKESAQWQFVKLLTKPSDVFRYIRSHRHESGLWARNNYKFAGLEVVFILILSFIWYVFPKFHFSIHILITNLFQYIVRDYVLFGALTATLFSMFLNKFGLAVRSYRESRQDVEWKFCFDAFCNGYVALIFDFFLGYPVIYLISLIFPNWFFTLFLPNTLLCISACHFLYLFIQTLNVLPFIRRIPYVIFFVPVFFVYFLSLVFGWPMARMWILGNFP
ncbi:hypothetical protein TRFO_26895 [Tritrichomonas foetus]|uniref:UNC-50 family protein n=1 Tax=Tritrichomonas foetus TaxID=1144522 RepID=A0A1J4K2I7_9EUKA|nr:hypothetical protein TRFO_26895 [Tritrichomonas foetus]|eukprot:OHT05411.1 hypothetical protein TRFO_26895 [Tritrichomonas foetus]